MKAKSRKTILSLSLIVISIGLALVFFAEKDEKDKEGTSLPENGLSEKMQEALDPNTHFDTEACIIGKKIPISGYISKKEENYIYVRPGKGENLEKKVELTPKTLFVRINFSEKGEALSQEEVKWEDFQKGDSVAVNAFCKEGESILIALTVKMIFLP